MAGGERTYTLRCAACADLYACLVMRNQMGSLHHAAAAVGAYR